MDAHSAPIPSTRRGPGRPRKQAAPKLPAYRPSISFMEHTARFGVAISFWLEAAGMKPARAIDLAACIADPSCEFELTGKAGWDRTQRDLVADHPGLAGNVLVSTTMRPRHKVASAVKAIRRCAARLKTDAAATGWLVASAKAVILLRATNDATRWVAARHLLILGWPEKLVDRLKPIT